MVKVTLEVTNKELDKLEDFIVAWNLCKKHNSIHGATDEEHYRFTQECKQCRKINKEIRNSSLHLWSKLVSAYEKARKDRRRNWHTND